MSSGKVHHEIWKRNRVSAVILACVTYGAVDPLRLSLSCADRYCFSGNLFCSIGVLFGYLMGAFITPDADQTGTTYAEGLMINKLPIIGHFMYGHWSTYGSIFRRHHRSFWTHFPMVSTAIRIIYQFWFLFWLIFDKHWYYPWIFQIFLGIFIGLSFADFLHWKEDIRSKEI